MIFNLNPVKNLTTLLGPRTVFLYDLFTHKEINICGHIYHLFVKSIKKRNARLILPFPSLVMSLILRARVKTPSGLPIMQRGDPISEQTIIWSKAHIPGPSFGVSQIPRGEEAVEEGNTNEEIDRFTSVLEDTPQPFSQEQARAPQPPWSSTCKGWRVAFDASFTHQLLHESIHIPSRPDYCPLVSN